MRLALFREGAGCLTWLRITFSHPPHMAVIPGEGSCMVAVVVIVLGRPGYIRDSPWQKPHAGVRRWRCCWGKMFPLHASHGDRPERMTMKLVPFVQARSA